ALSLLLLTHYLSLFCTTPTPTEIYTLSLHDALPIFGRRTAVEEAERPGDDRRLQHLLLGHLHLEMRLRVAGAIAMVLDRHLGERSEEHTSELQSRSDLVCRLLLEKKKR